MKARMIGFAALCALLLAPGFGQAFLAVGDKALDFTAESLDHQTFSLSDYSGKIVVLFLLKTSNARCGTAAPAYEQSVYQPYKDRAVVALGIDIDPVNETFDNLASFRDEYGLSFPLAMDVNGECFSKYRADDAGNVPVFYVIDRSASISTILIGYRAGREQTTIDAIEAILAKERPVIDLSLNRPAGDMTPYMPGDTMQVFASVENPAPYSVDVMAFVAVGIGPQLFFWPSYGTIPEGTPLTLPAGFAVERYPLESVVLNEAFMPGIYAWFGLLTDAVTGKWLQDVDMVSWPFGLHERPPEDRASLVVPDELWDFVCSKAGGSPLGFDEATMEKCNFYGHEFRLHQVWDLWRDVRGVVSFSGDVGDFLLANHDDPAACASFLFNMLPFEGQILTEPAPAVHPGSLEAPVIFDFKTPQDQANWGTLQPAVQDFVSAIVEASVSASPIVESAFDKEFLASTLGVAVGDLDTVSRSDLYNLVTEPWWNYANPNAPGFEALYKLNLPALASGTSTFLSGVTNAINQLKAWLAAGNTIEPTTFETIEFGSPAGDVLVCGTGNQQVFDEYSLIIDLGGNDTYYGSHAVPRSFSHPIGAIVDVAGNDIYRAGPGAFNLCCGLFGVGAIFDLSGDDQYYGGQSTLASAWHGAGILVDYEGNDHYDTNVENSSWTEGAAHAGVGLLMDLAGDDSYDCLQYSQGYGATLGVGAIVDVSGNDTYHAEGVYSDPFFTNVAFAQGAGNGRRADAATGGDGRCLGGGIGILVDGAGDDDYWGPVYVQGCGYWWGLGIFEERGGNDTYRSWEYSMGAAPHMSIGCMVDLSGDDTYNTTDVQQQYRVLGHGRDGSIGIFIDGAGNDKYLLNWLSGGSGDLNSIGLFWDRSGDDTYYVSNNNQSFGAAYPYGPDGTFRDTMNTIGVFLDTQGHDNYIFAEPGVGPLCADSKEWQHQSGPYFWGFGLDMDWYAPEQKEN